MTQVSALDDKVPLNANHLQNQIVKTDLSALIHQIVQWTLQKTYPRWQGRDIRHLLYSDTLPSSHSARIKPRAQIV